MAEVKNSFISSKMNKDLDDRLIPKNEYRDALNIAVSRSEAGDVGALESILGNSKVTSSSYDTSGEIIGYFVDNTSSLVYYFKTDWYSKEIAPDTANCQILVYNSLNNQTNLLLEGYWLNFSTKNPIFGVNLMEDLLFWTDNRNQPRKINVQTAINEGSSHYYKENHISVAKYNPYQPISLIKEETEDVISVASTTVFDIPENTNVVAGMIVLGSDSSGSTTIEPNECITVVSSVASTIPGRTTVTISDAPATAITATDTIYFITSTMTDKSSVSTWPGDPDYLEEKFVRFAYRFKFEDNEYSIISPFTQIAFIPKQKGYFIKGQEDSAVQSTIVNWFENNVNNIELIIPLPDTIGNVASSYKLKEIDILYKESDQTTVKVVDSISLDGVTGDNNFYIYNYQSTKPIRTLPEDQTTRVYDKVPVKAMGQEIIANRVVYSNYQTKHTPPRSINYNVNVQSKIGLGQYPNFIEYPNHTVKQNRNYQVGIVLSDKFGRQSDVILSSGQGNGIDVGGVFFAGSTIYNEYIQDEPNGSGNIDAGDMPDGVINWPGSSLVMAVNTPITSTKTENSAPGLYAQEAGRFDLLASSTTTITDSTYTFEIDPNGNITIPSKGEYLRGDTLDYVEVTNVNNAGGNVYEVTTSGRVNDLYAAETVNLTDTKFSYTINTLGWYYYKIVVKQTEQEYYNVYLPSAVAGGDFIADSTDTDESVSYITLVNDNINKVPRDLVEVGPDQKQYRSSVKLFGRVKPTGSAAGTFSSTQFYPFRSSDISTSIGNTDDLLGDSLSSDKTAAIFQYNSNPIVSRVSTEEQFGLNYTNFTHSQGNLKLDRFQLAVYETEPFISNLDIYWETASTGLISDLNWDVNVGYDGPVSLQDTNFSFIEDNPEKGQPGNQDLTGTFYPLSNTGVEMQNTVLGGYTVTNGLGQNVTNDFEVSQTTLTSTQPNAYYVQHLRPFVYENGSYDEDVFTFEIEITDPSPSSSWSSVTLPFEGSLTNITPSFVVPTPPYYYFDSTFTTGQTIHDFKDTSNAAVNGSVDAANDTVGFRWKINSGNGNGYFALNQNTGILSLTSAGTSASIGTYPLVIELCDAADNGVLDPGSICTTKSISIIKGWPRSSAGEGQGELQDGFLNYGESVSSLFAYYASDSTLTASDLPSASVAFDNTPEKLGNTLTEGELLFGITHGVEHDDMGPFNTPVKAYFYFTTYHRATPTDAWVAVRDINNNNGFYGYTFKNDLNDSRSPSFSAAAHGTPGEYAFFVSVSASVSSSGSQDPLAWYFDADLTDLHYSGLNQSQQVYEYDLYTVGGNGYTTLTSVGDNSLPSGPVHTVYSEVPLGEYVRTFYVDSSLTNVYNTTSTPAIGTANRYYPFKQGGSGSRTRYPDLGGIWSSNTENVWFEVKLDSDGLKDESSTSDYTVSYQNSRIDPFGTY